MDHSQHIPIPCVTVPCKYRCCNVRYCPLVPAWATTIHKFQGGEAGKEDHYIFKSIIINPGPLDQENRSTGLLYTAVSRGKTMGSMSETNKHPTDSTIYFDGNHIGLHRILHTGTRKKADGSDGREPNEGARKRNQWMAKLIASAEETKNNVSIEQLRDMEANARNVETRQPFTQDELTEMILNMLYQPNEDWKERRKKHLVQ